jgi:hypothetical protein
VVVEGVILKETTEILMMVTETKVAMEILEKVEDSVISMEVVIQACTAVMVHARMTTGVKILQVNAFCVSYMIMVSRQEAVCPLVLLVTMGVFQVPSHLLIGA